MTSSTTPPIAYKPSTSEYVLATLGAVGLTATGLYLKTAKGIFQTFLDRFPSAPSLDVILQFAAPPIALAASSIGKKLRYAIGLPSLLPVGVAFYQACAHKKTETGYSNIDIFEDFAISGGLTASAGLFGGLVIYQALKSRKSSTP